MKGTLGLSRKKEGLSLPTGLGAAHVGERAPSPRGLCDHAENAGCVHPCISSPAYFDLPPNFPLWFAESGRSLLQSQRVVLRSIP